MISGVPDQAAVQLVQALTKSRIDCAGRRRYGIASNRGIKWLRVDRCDSVRDLACIASRVSNDPRVPVAQGGKPGGPVHVSMPFWISGMIPDQGAPTSLCQARSTLNLRLDGGCRKCRLAKGRFGGSIVVCIGTLELSAME